MLGFYLQKCTSFLVCLSSKTTIHEGSELDRGSSRETHGEVHGDGRETAERDQSAPRGLGGAGGAAEQNAGREQGTASARLGLRI